MRTKEKLVVSISAHKGLDERVQEHVKNVNRKDHTLFNKSSWIVQTILRRLDEDESRYSST